MSTRRASGGEPGARCRITHWVIGSERCKARDGKGVRGGTARRATCRAPSRGFRGPRRRLGGRTSMKHGHPMRKPVWGGTTSRLRPYRPAGLAWRGHGENAGRRTRPRPYPKRKIPLVKVTSKSCSSPQASIIARLVMVWLMWRRKTHVPSMFMVNTLSGVTSIIRGSFRGTP